MAAACALGLLVAFSVAIVRALLQGRRPDCHCFGQLHSMPAGWTTLARDVWLAIIAAFVAIMGWQDLGPSAFSWVQHVSTGALVASGGVLLLIAVLGFDAWFSLELLRQNGRILLRLEAIERMLTAGSSRSRECQRYPVRSEIAPLVLHCLT